MLKDSILVIAGIVVFMIPAILQKGRRSQLKNDFPCQLSKMAVLSGLFVSIVELVVLIADLENKSGTEGTFSILSRREKEVARLAAKGYTNAQIAEELYISTETVKRHMSTIFEKLGIESRKQLLKEKK